MAVFLTAAVAGYASADGCLPVRMAAAWYEEAAAILLHNLQFVVLLFVFSVLTYGFGGYVLLAVNGMIFGVVVGMVPIDKAWWIFIYAPVEVLAYAAISASAMSMAGTVVSWLHTGAWPSDLGEVTRVQVAMYGVLLGAWLEAWAIVGAWG